MNGSAGRDTVAAPRQARGHSVWVPRQHGAWAMLALPFLLGIAASHASPWQIVLGVAALAAYLGSAAFQAWSRARRPTSYRPPILVYGAIVVVLGGVLVIAWPALLLAAVVVLPAGALVFRGARPGTPRDLVNSFAQVAQALVLVPAAAYVSGDFELARVAAYLAVAAAYLVGTVLVVRSVLRERGNDRFAALSIGFHAAVTIGAVVALPWPYGLLAAGLTVRAIALPVIQRRRAGTSRPLRPIHVGIVEIVASLAVVVVAFAVPL